METFLSIHQDDVVGTLSMFDRMIFKGYLTGFFPKGVLLKDFSSFVQERTKTLKAHLEHMAQAAGRPLQYLSSPKGLSKEDLARTIAERDGVTEGLVCVFSVLETCMSFDVQGNRQSHKLEVVRRPRKCLHYYCYYLDAEFGLMHIRLQSWFPFDIQIYVNGREWLARQLDQRGIRYDRYDNKLIHIADLETAQTLCERFTRRKWLRVLHALARRVNPFFARHPQSGVW